MMLFRPLLVLGMAFVLALAGSTGNAEAAKKKAMPKAGAKKGTEHAHHGVVEKVHLDKDKDHGSLTIKHHHHKKGVSKAKGKGPAKGMAGKGHGGKEEHFVLTKMTKVHRHGKPVALKALHPGEHVVVVSKGKFAESIEIVKAKHKKKLNKKKKAAKA